MTHTPSHRPPFSVGDIQGPQTQSPLQILPSPGFGTRRCSLFFLIEAGCLREPPSLQGREGFPMPRCHTKMWPEGPATLFSISFHSNGGAVLVSLLLSSCFMSPWVPNLGSWKGATDGASSHPQQLAVTPDAPSLPIQLSPHELKVETGAFSSSLRFASFYLYNLGEVTSPPGASV